MDQNPQNNRLLHPDLAMNHRIDIQIRFADYDTFGHINNNSYLAYFDLGKAEFFSHVLGRPCSPTDLSAVIVNISVDFLAPATIGEPLVVLSAVSRIGERSFSVYQRVVNPATGSVKSQATTVLAGFDMAVQGPGPLNPVLVEALRAYSSLSE